MCQLISLNIIYVYCISMLHQIKEMQDCYFNIWIWMLCKSWTLPLANAFTKLLKSLSQWSLNFVYTDAVHSASKGKDWHTWTSTHTHTRAVHWGRCLMSSDAPLPIKRKGDEWCQSSLWLHDPVSPGFSNLMTSNLGLPRRWRRVGGKDGNNVDSRIFRA